jgi:hypothetical protein
LIIIKIDQFLKNLVPRSAARVAKHVPPRRHLVGDPAEPRGGPHALDAAIDPRGLPSCRQAPEILINGRVSALQKFLNIAPWDHGDVQAEVQAVCADELVPTAADSPILGPDRAVA